MSLHTNWAELLWQIIAGLIATAIAAAIAAVAVYFWRRGLHEFVKSLPGRLRLATKRLLAHWRYLCIVALLVLFEMAVYRVSLNWMIVTLSTAHLALIAVTAWLLIPVGKTTGMWAPCRRSPIVFTDDFTGDLADNWEFEGEWHISDKGTLVVGESDRGGITKTGADWHDYAFSFRARIINKNLGIIIRAQDSNNYEMLQIRGNGYVVPHHRRVPHPKEWSSPWKVLRDCKEPHRCPNIKNWFDVLVITRGDLVSLYINGDRVFHRDDFIEMSKGAVGFRCAPLGISEAPEKAEIRDVEVSVRV